MDQGSSSQAQPGSEDDDSSHVDKGSDDASHSRQRVRNGRYPAADERRQEHDPHPSRRPRKDGNDPNAGENGKRQADEQPEDERRDKKEGDEEKKAKPWSFRKKLVVFGILGLCIVVGLIVGISWWLVARQYESTDDAFVDAHWEKVGPQVAGRVLSVNVDDNQHVDAGQVIVEIDPSDYQAQVERAAAALAEANGRVQQARAQRVVAEANVEQSKADVDRAAVNRDNARVELERYQGLSAEAASPQRLDDLRAGARTTEAQLNASRSALAAAQAQVVLADSQIKTSESSVSSAQAQLDLAKLRLGWTHVTARTSGRVTQRGVQPGDYVAVGQQLLLIVPNELYVTANYKETQLELMRPGQSVDIRIDSFPDQHLSGKVQSIQRGSGPWFSLLPPENATGNYVKVVQRVPVKITFDDTNSETYKLIGPGMSVVPKVKVR